MDEKDLLERTDLCTLCGSCNSSCPVFGIERTEPYSPRGRINLIREVLINNIHDSEEMREMISVCLMCGYCVNSCSRGVDFMSIFRGYLALPFSQENDKSPD